MNVFLFNVSVYFRGAAAFTRTGNSMSCSRFGSIRLPQCPTVGLQPTGVLVSPCERLPSALACAEDPLPFALCHAFYPTMYDALQCKICYLVFGATTALPLIQPGDRILVVQREQSCRGAHASYACTNNANPADPVSPLGSGTHLER